MRVSLEGGDVAGMEIVYCPPGWWVFPVCPSRLNLGTTTVLWWRDVAGGVSLAHKPSLLSPRYKWLLVTTVLFDWF